MRFFQRLALAVTLTVAASLHGPILNAQRALGGITGTVKDPAGAAVPDATVTAREITTNLTVTAPTKSNGSFSFPDLPIGTYEVSFSKTGFEKETHPQIVVEANRTATVNGSLQVGKQSITVEVNATPLMNQVDTTNGYVVDQHIIQSTPLGTGSFTQLAIIAPGVSADFLGGSGSNAGLGNQAIFANGQRDSSNSFSLNGIGTNNLFNGKSTSQVGENRFVLNTGENFGPGGDIQTSTSVYSAIGQALPTPAPESIQEIRVDVSNYNATQGSNSGAHIGVSTKSGTNDFHGELYEHFQNSFWNAAPFFYNATPQISPKVPKLDRNQYGATLGGPVIKNKLFFFASYAGVQVRDALLGTQFVTVPQQLTNDRSNTGIANAVNASFGTTVTPSQIDPIASKLLNYKLPNGQYLIPSANIPASQAASLGANAVIQGPSSQSSVDQGSLNFDYNVSDKDRLSVKYYIQDDPTTNPFGAGSSTLGFTQQLSAGSQVASIENTVVLSPSLTWEQHIGFTRLRAYAGTSQPFTSGDFGINVFGSNRFPAINVQTSDGALGNAFAFGPASNFSNAGMFQNQWEYESNIGWVVGRHTLTFGAQWDHSQLNILNRNNDTATLSFVNFSDFATGAVRPGINSALFNGNSNRYYHSDTIGTYVNDSYKVTSNLTVTMGVRWDYDGPLSEKYGRLTNFNPNLYQYNQASDTIVNSGIVFAGNNPDFHTPGVSNSTMSARQWGVAPRFGVAWTPYSKLTVRTGFGLYYDRGQFFSELSPSAGGGYNGPFGVTLEPPFVTPVTAQPGAPFSAPFGTTPPAPPPVSAAAFQALLPNKSQLESFNYPAGNNFGPFLFGGYDANSKLPYSENYTFDLQYQAANNLLVTLGYSGTHGLHLVLPIPFNQPLVATPQHPVNGEIYSYGYAINGYEPFNTSTGGNTDLRVPYVGYSPNSVLYKAEGISWYNALLFSLTKRLSNGLQFTASYTWSHSLDEQSGLGLFYNGNDPLNPKSGYATSDFDRTHVFLVNYSYQLPSIAKGNKFLGALLNGWQIGGQTVAESGQPYNVYDFSGSVASIYYSANDYITNPVLPLASGYTAGTAQLQGTTGVNAGKPVLNVNAFYPQFLQPGQSGVPPCDAFAQSTGGCDTFESGYGGGGRNIFRGPFQVRFDNTLGKEFRLTERVHLRFNFDAFNVFNHPSFDTPNNNVSYYNFGPPVLNPPRGSLGEIQHTIGSPRFLQADLHLTF
ncbi:MAG: carboxypeptidase regulatory-like domain-containing protein [Acidobacteriota bacterium]|nr:carboxypeptidase regulatory-like domain-containing protein [Acidobacteriota bacterium]